MTSLNDLLEAAKAVEDDKGKTFYFKIQEISLCLQSTWLTLFSTWLSYAKIRHGVTEFSAVFFCNILEIISPYKRKRHSRHRRDIERTQG